MRNPKDLELKSKVPGADQLNYSQKWAKAVRPQKPADNTQMGQPVWTPGTMPKGGFRSVFDFSDRQPTSTKLSKTSGGGKTVY
jgi:hypothetical protein